MILYLQNYALSLPKEKQQLSDFWIHGMQKLIQRGKEFQ